MNRHAGKSAAPPPIYVVSGGVGASGEQLVRTALAQFPDQEVPILTTGNARYAGQMREVVGQARQSGGTIVHTLVDARLRATLEAQAADAGVAAIDLMGPLLSRLAQTLGQAPLEQPGLYRRSHQAYFERVAAMEYTMAHDDGQNPEGWPQAEIVLLGVSRTGKTPLSIYLSVLGWKVANIPLIPDMPLPPGLARLDARRVVGLTMDPDQLLMFREQRRKRIGQGCPPDYVEPERVEEEMRVARRIYREGGFVVVDVTDKPIETSADEVIRRVTARPRPEAAAPQ